MGRVGSVLTGFALLFLLITSLSLVAPPGAMPVMLTSPVSDSMVPTVTQGDVVIVTGGEVEEGEIILFETSQHNRNVLHRAVNTTGSGEFITQGDANELTDQEDGFEPVSRGDIYGSVVTVGGSPLSVPVIGAVLSNPTAVLSIWVVISLVTFAPAIFGNDDENTTQSTSVNRNTSDRKIIIGVAICAMLILPAAILGTPVSENATIITSESVSPDADAQRAAAIGHSTTQEVTLTSKSLIGMTQTAHVEGDLRSEKVESPALKAKTRVYVSNPPRDSPTADTAQITLYSYPSTLPRSALQALANIHPALAAIASTGVISLTLIALSFILITPNTNTRRKRSTIYKQRRR